MLITFLFMAFLNPSLLFDNLNTELARQYAADPVNTDTRINDYINSQVGPFPNTPLQYFQKCGKGIFYPQTCEHKERVQSEVIAARNAYNARYAAARAVLMAGLTNTLKNSPNKEAIRPLFQEGETKLQNAISQETKKISSLAKYSNLAWSIAKLIPGAGTIASYSQNIIGEISTTLNIDVSTLHRFSEEPPGLSDKGLSVKGLQWDHARAIITYLEIGKEYETMYKTAYPTTSQTITANAGNIAALGAAAFVLKKF